MPEAHGALGAGGVCWITVCFWEAALEIAERQQHCSGGCR